MSRNRNIDRLRQRVDRLAGATHIARDKTSLFATGHAGLDAWMGGGLKRGCVHEIFAETAMDMGAMAAAALGLAWLARGAGDGALLWLSSDRAERQDGLAYGPGLVHLGFDASAFILGRVPDTVALLRAATDALRCPPLGALLIDYDGPSSAIDLTTSRRLALAARDSGVTAFLLRGTADPAPSAAETRWRASAVPSRVLEANAPGEPLIALDLLRRRAGPAGKRWHLEWDRHAKTFREPPVSGAVVSLVERGTPAADDAERRVRRTPGLP